MSIYFVCFDPPKPLDNEHLRKELRIMGAKEVLPAIWSFKEISERCSEIFKHLSPYIDECANERLLIIQQDIDAGTSIAINPMKQIFKN